ncbi:uncharacterized protein J8A68_003351 [[Candida] subhashii]|uniref:Uncharacterized protein n=1 Tax=[Candida] subhashii TaxID=561895 RepID=A0A8J5QMP5_9ASCO|nr:uncharacterized protein J8A68_003351 [[Candida] subhashii]KAG7663173.1 hypothetical protein J8A68_003351 [[Candida] subhashii]
MVNNANPNIQINSISFIKVTRELVESLILNSITYFLIFIILLLFQLRDTIISANKLLVILGLTLLEFIMMIPFILIRLVYVFSETNNERKQLDDRYSSRGIIRLYTLHSMFWQYQQTLGFTLEIIRVSKAGINLFLEVVDDFEHQEVVPQLIEEPVVDEEVAGVADVTNREIVVKNDENDEFDNPELADISTEAIPDWPQARHFRTFKRLKRVSSEPTFKFPQRMSLKSFVRAKELDQPDLSE